jgi:DNA-binding MarR family transcriptional regulator
MKIERYISSSPFISVLCTAQKISRSFKKEFGDLNYLQSITLVALYFDRNEIVTPTQLAKALGVGESSVSQAVTSLQKKKLVRRESLESDARKFSLVVTPPGVQRVNKLIKGFEGLQKRLERNIGTSRAEQLSTEIVALSNVIS